MRVGLDKGGWCKVGSNHFLIFKFKFITFEKIEFKITPCERIEIFSILFLYLFTFLSSSHEKAAGCKTSSFAKDFPVICLPYLDGDIPFSAFPNDATSELAGLLLTILLVLNVKQESYEY